MWGKILLLTKTKTTCCIYIIGTPNDSYKLAGKLSQLVKNL